MTIPNIAESQRVAARDVGFLCLFLIVLGVSAQFCARQTDAEQTLKIGLAFAAIFLAAAVRLCRYREPI